MWEVNHERWCSAEGGVIICVTAKESWTRIESKIDEAIINQVFEMILRLLIRDVREDHITRGIEHEFFIGCYVCGTVGPVLSICAGIDTEDEIYMSFFLKERPERYVLKIFALES